MRSFEECVRRRLFLTIQNRLRTCEEKNKNDTQDHLAAKKKQWTMNALSPNVTWN